MKQAPRYSLLVALAAFCSCRAVTLEPDRGVPGGNTGTTDGGVAADDAGAGPDGGIVAVPDPNDAPGPTSARRLSALEYSNTVRDLLGYQVAPPSGSLLAVEGSGGGFPVGGQVTSGTDARDVLLGAEAASAAAVQNLGALLPATCSPPPVGSAAEDACATAFIADFGLRAFRRPLSADEATALHTLYLAERGPAINGAFSDGIRVLISAMLQSPYFLYRWEMSGPPVRDGALVRFGPYEIASRLSYFFWASMPDAALFAAAAAGQLNNPAGVQAQARRLLADPRAAASMTAFHAAWLMIDNLPQEPKDMSFTSYTPKLAQSMLDETSAFVTQLFVGPSATGKLETLLTSSTSFVDDGLAALYGVNSPGPTLHPAALDPHQRAGILTQASVLASTADASRPDPAERGTLVLDRLLCADVQLPNNVDIPALPDPQPNVPNRQEFEMAVNNPCTTGCHQVYEIGFAFENYDAIGAFRTTDAGQPVNASSTIHLGGADVPLTGAVDLARALAGSAELPACLARQWLRYLNRRMDGPGDAVSLRAAGVELARSSNDLRELLVALVATRTFTHRSPSAGEVLP
jgi:hypothetical protein